MLELDTTLTHTGLPVGGPSFSISTSTLSHWATNIAISSCNDFSISNTLLIHLSSLSFLFINSIYPLIRFHSVVI